MMAAGGLGPPAACLACLKLLELGHQGFGYCDQLICCRIVNLLDPLSVHLVDEIPERTKVGTSMAVL